MKIQTTEDERKDILGVITRAKAWMKIRERFGKGSFLFALTTVVLDHRHSYSGNLSKKILDSRILAMKLFSLNISYLIC